MKDIIRVGIVGYGNLGKACERVAINRNDVKIVGIFSRRAQNVTSPYQTPVFPYEDLQYHKNEIDVVMLAVGSQSDLVGVALKTAHNFNTVDAYDNHAKMSEYVAALDDVNKTYGTLSYVGMGWDPGIFSLVRCLFDGVLSDGNAETFWGKGVSQGHSEAIKKIDGVVRAVQYTVPIESAVAKAKLGGKCALTAQEKHKRVCFLVVDENADKRKIEREIKNMPDYFQGYETVVNFISNGEFEKNHTEMPHGGMVIKSGTVSGENVEMVFDMKTDSNPDFTASILVSYAVACARQARQGDTGAYCIFNLPLDILFEEKTQLIKRFL